ncbi:MAG: tetraacyldisaccharide 4'-kinase [Magnetococcus sp. DMHC-8]
MKRLLPLLEGRATPTTRTARTTLQVLGGVGHLYGAIMQGRAGLYRRRILPSFRAPCPVISVGNLTAGGTGKTPMVLWLARQLAHGPHRLAIVSRGYGTPAASQPGQPEGVTVVADPDGVRIHPPRAADEAALLARHLPGVTILTGADRARLIRFAVTQYGVGLILMDDGFQHLRVQRDLDLVLLDARHPLGNGALLPGGILRERPQALHRADGLVVTRCGDAALFAQASATLARFAPDKPILQADHQPTAWQQPGDAQTLPLSTLADTPVLAFCGIARPDSFARLLAQTRTSVTGWQIFPDHFAFTRQTLATLIRQGHATRAQALVCTAKDAVKIPPAWLEAFTPTLPLFVLQMEMVFPTAPVWLQAQLATLAGITYSPDAAPRPPA